MSARKGARAGMIGGASLLAICFLVCGAPQAMEPEAPGASPPAFAAPTLPSFLDNDSLPALLGAWQEHDAAAGAQHGEAPAAQPPAAVPPIEQSMEAARAAMERAKQAGEDGASVRERAEELSRRFGAGAATAEPPPTSVMIPPAVVPEVPEQQDKRVLAKPELPLPETPKRKMFAKPVTTGAVPSSETPSLDTAVRTLDEPAGEKLRLAAPPPPSLDVPPLPRRAPKVRGFTARPAALEKLEKKIAKPAAAESKPVVRAKPAPPRVRTSKSPTLEELRGTVLPSDLGSFGWNTKPN